MDAGVASSSAVNRNENFLRRVHKPCRTRRQTCKRVLLLLLIIIDDLALAIVKSAAERAHAGDGSSWPPSWQGSHKGQRAEEGKRRRMICLRKLSPLCLEAPASTRNRLAPATREHEDNATEFPPTSARVRSQG